MTRKQVDQSEHEPRQEAEDGNALENIEQRQHQPLGPSHARRRVAVNQREQERHAVGDDSTRQAEHRVERQVTRRQVNLRDRLQRAAPFTSDRHHRVNKPDQQANDGQVNPIEGALCPAQLFGGAHDCSPAEPGDGRERRGAA